MINNFAKHRIYFRSETKHLIEDLANQICAMRGPFVILILHCCIRNIWSVAVVIVRYLAAAAQVRFNASELFSLNLESKSAKS